MKVLWYMCAPDGPFPWKPEGSRVVDYGYYKQLAQAYDHLGYTGALFATGAHDVWVLAAALADATKRMKFLCAIHPGVVAPTLLADCTPDMHAVREEAFGPVVVVLSHDGDDEAVAMANDSAYGLYSYVYAGDMARAYRIARRLESGNVALNSVVPHPNAPFGGFKESGIGRDRGIAGLEAYSEVQAISWLA